MSQESLSLRSGTLVEARGERWRVLESIEHGGCATCRLIGVGSSNMGARRALLLPFDHPRPVVASRRWRRVGRRRWVGALRALLASDATANGLRGAARARLDLLEYQLEPALACANGTARLLLADEVGLGKTIQAALILANLCARSDSARALVLCPASLCGQWQEELSARFDLSATIVNLGALRGLFRGAGPEHVPWDRVPLAIASVDFVKRPEVLQGMAHIRWDLLVVDEAHLSALAPERAAAVNWLARRSRRVALLTATPHPGEAGAFEALCRVGRLAGEGPITLFRRTRAGLGLPADRRVRIIRVRLSPAERQLHAALRRYTSRVWKGGPETPEAADARLAMVVLSKRAASGPAPLLASLERRLRWLDRAHDATASQLLLPLGEPDSDDADEEPSSVLAAPGLASRQAELEIVGNLIRLARDALSFDSKGRALTRLLRRVRQPAVVFTEYRDALSRAASLVAEDDRAAIVHGGLDRRARTEAVRAFTRGNAGLLLATDAAAHGLNLQARCRLVVNLDLPWNPVRLEQRIGRVDRIGQRRVVHAIHIVGRGTTEAVVLDRLAVRTARMRRALGDAPNLGTPAPAPDPRAAFAPASGEPDAEMAVADTVFRARHPRARRAADGGVGRPAVSSSSGEEEGEAQLPSGSLRAEADAEVERLTFLRELQEPKPGRRRHDANDLAGLGALWTRLRFRRPHPARLLAIFRAEVVDGRGFLQEQLLVPLEAGVDAVFLPSGSAWLEQLHALGRALQPRASAAAREELARLEAAVRPRLEAERAREAALSAVSDAVPVAAIQPGLFDRRALRRAEAESDLRARLLEETRGRLLDVDRAAHLQLSMPPELVLLGLVRGR